MRLISLAPVVALAGCTALSGAHEPPGSGSPDASGVADTAPPRVKVLAPRNGDALGAGPHTIRVTANDDVGVVQVDIRIDDQLAGTAGLVSGVPQNGTWEYAWDPAPGSYSVEAVARDAADNAAADVVEVSVGEGGGGGGEGGGGGGETHAPVELGPIAGNFGPLGMYIHVPPGMEVDRAYPLVVVLHGCWEDAAVHAANSGWNALADAHRFYVLHAENAQQIQQCFDWYSALAQGGGGEAAAVMSMIDRFAADYRIDDGRIYLSGFSAGGGLAVILAARHPETFAAAAIHAGLPYRGYTGSDVGTLGYIFSEQPRSPAEWAALMPQNPGTYPPILAFYGTDDGTVHHTFTRELMKQWTAVHGVDQVADVTAPLKPGHSAHDYAEYHDGGGRVVIATVALTGMSHGYAVDPTGSGADAGGSVAASLPGKPSYGKDHGLYAMYYAARFFDLVE